MDGVQLATKVKNNMKNSIMSVADNICLRKRVQIGHFRNKSFKILSQILLELSLHIVSLRKSQTSNWVLSMTSSILYSNFILNSH